MINYRSKHKKAGYYVLTLSWVFLFIEYALRISDSVIIPELSKTFHIEASGIGILSSCYYFPYVIMQIPAGILLDRLGIKKSLFCGMLCVATGALIMSSATSLTMIMIARILMGTGSAFAFIGSIRILYTYLNLKYKSFWIGITMTIATLGAVCGQEPWYLLVKLLGDWRYSYFITGGGLLITALLLTYSSLPTNKFNHTHSNNPSIKKNLNWTLLIYVGLLSAPMTAFAALWGIPFLTQGWQWSRDMAASAMSLTWMGGLIGGPLLGYFADHFSIHKKILVVIGILASAIMCVILFAHTAILTTTILLAVLGALCNGNVIVFAIISNLVPKKSVGFANGFTNMFNMGGGPLFQVLVGWILSLQTVLLIRGVPTYSLAAYQRALFIIPGLLLFFSIVLSQTIHQRFLRSVNHENSRL
ncbi:MAG: MFS transporter [Gammaproteobacteria bacterium]|nr:MFS transporter [Gammaproteobacteria bacterium]